MAGRTVSFTTFNLLNLNEPGLPIYRDRDGWDADIHARKIAWTGAKLQEMQADVFGFQELWHADSLTAALAAAGLGDSHVAVAPPGQSGQRIVCAAAVARDIMVGTPEWITDFPDDFILQSSGDDPQTSEIEVKISTFSRPVLRFEIKPRSDGPVVSVYVCHFKSKAPTQIWREGWYDKDIHSRHRDAIGAGLSTIRRTAEATALRMILTEEMKDTDRPVVVLGDCNDGQLSNTLNIMTGQPRFLTGLREGGGDTALYTAQTLQQLRSTTDVYYTHVYQDIRESLDHILVSQEFYDMSRRRIWAFDGLEIANDHLNDDNHKETGTGDHGVVRARFRYSPTSAAVV
ncbi:endonuclease/exonuclease/phosphatase family protein [Jannaschia pohangensis]|uniref:Endonuclease/Exonuclease/phosphatase family protein n=1 Tax=Jannaschia pohangensis TaxID=390807 RepID=A0A1I3JQ92_9RHOB|nr:endonuclease/exonuclease/phosphatase family protein [Jannaschia pohangensis]SFI62178.1 Endonuclease/Exonuclease/phosphatase family protein [Jannaschia pohangensis]